MPLPLDLANPVSLTPHQALGIPIALLGATFLSMGAHFQHRGVVKVEASLGSGRKAGLAPRQLVALLHRPSWVIGTIMLGLAIGLQLTSLVFAPLIVVQPLGAFALVVTALVQARTSHLRLPRTALVAVGMCVAGVGVFVTIAAFVATETAILQPQLVVILSIMGSVTLVLAAAFALVRKRATAVFYILGAGVLYGFVATLAKVVINRVMTGNFEILTILAIVGLLAAVALGAYFVQTAYSVGSPDLVIAGLTVVDPLVAVGIGIGVLGEAAEAPWFAVVLFVLAAAVAVYGVFQLARHQPRIERTPAPGRAG